VIRKSAAAHAGGSLNGSERAVDSHSNHEDCPCIETSGTVVAMRHVPGFRVIENHYPAGLELGRHHHEHAYLSYVLEGPYGESYGNSATVTCAPRVLRYLPPGQPHANTFDSGSHCLVVEVEREALKRVNEHSTALDKPGEIQGIGSTWLAQRLYHEFRQGANFLRPLSLAEIAGAAGVHRVHLSREFRRYFSTTVGEFLRRKRIEHACHLVSTSNTALAEIAMTCGFSDQSHFSATFRRQVGLTPARFRQMAQAR
jgi:AraC-like DNA-binding protein